jgi:protein TonB
MGRTQLIAISLGAHVALGLGLGTIPPKHHREVIAITVADVKKKAPPPHVDPPPEPEARAAPRPLRAKSAPLPAKTAPVTPSANVQPAASLDALPDFGVALSGGPGGMAIPAGGARGPSPATTMAAKVLSRTAARADVCGDPPAKPKLSSRPSPAYTEAARAAGISGKVRVELTVDEQGRVVGVRVLQGLGYGLDEAAIAAARALTFEPAIRCGKPSAATFKIGFNFAP